MYVTRGDTENWSRSKREWERGMSVDNFLEELSCKGKQRSDSGWRKCGYTVESSFWFVFVL